MKKIAALILLMTSILASAMDFGSGADLYARAYEKVDHAYYNVYGAGLKTESHFRQEVQYSVRGVRNSSELMTPLNFTYVLAFDNYKSEVMERVDVVAADGEQLFVSNLNWKPEETLSEDGKTLSYAMPGNAGSIHLFLVDRKVLADEGVYFVQVQMDGYTLDLHVDDGYITVPGWVYENEGSFVVWKNGKKIVTDIQTGLPVVGGKEIVSTRPSGINGLEPVYISGLSLNLRSPTEYCPVYEVIVPQNGLLKISIEDYYGNQPEGIWITEVGHGLEPVYYHVTKDGFTVPVTKDKTIHIKCRWYKMSKG